MFIVKTVLPLVCILFLLEFFFGYLGTDGLLDLLAGSIMVMAGLFLFLQGVNVSVIPLGRAIGSQLPQKTSTAIVVMLAFFLALVINASDPAVHILAGHVDSMTPEESIPPWLLIACIALFGFWLTRAEPAVNILCSQVERTTAGSIPAPFLALGISLGVAVFAALGMGRVLLGFPLLYLLVPGYLLVLVLTLKSPPLFVGIAYDACTVTTGPMVITFVMSLALGLAMVLQGRDPLLDGFGLVALVALAPIVAVLLVGLAYQRIIAKGG